MKYAGLILLFLLPYTVSGQQNYILNGAIRDTTGSPVRYANIYAEGTNLGTSADSTGMFRLVLENNKNYTLVISAVGYINKKISVSTISGKGKTISLILKSSSKELKEVEVYGSRARPPGFIQIELKDFHILPNASGNIESILKTMPGVSSSNELSSQYSVRGGNFDENLVYVNDIEIYRPFLVRSGKQEGLSFVNPDMVYSIQFSAGGFDASYGDKMASVLDIRYRKPTEFSGSFTFSLLGGSAHIEDISANKKFTYISGFRYKSNQYLLNTFDTKGDYKPSFTDWQTYLNYELSEKLDIGFLGNFASNSYQFIPENRRTSFGTVKDAVQLFVLYDGQEIDRFTTLTGAVSANYRPNDKVEIKNIISAFNTREQETFDIEGFYSLNALDREIGSENLGDSIMNIGVGHFIDHARNNLDATVLSISQKGKYKSGKSILEWGLKIKHEVINDQIREWKLVDSAGFSLPYSDEEVNLAESRYANNRLSSNRYTSYLQHTGLYSIGTTAIQVNGGLRFHYWDLNSQFLLSPRGIIYIEPAWLNDWRFHLSTGIYYQPPFYKELRMPDGSLNKNIEAQKSVHCVAGSEFNFIAWERPFRFTTEVYYKKLDQLVPYFIDNVRIDYVGQNIAHGYVTGIELKINGEFVDDAESWASLSIMQAREDIENDSYINDDGETIYPGSYPRPTDQLLNFSLFFQDYFPGNPTYRVHLIMHYGTGLPTKPATTERFDQYFRMPSYRRVDIGFSKTFSAGDNSRLMNGVLRHLETIRIGAEIFNLLDINNTVSYIWIRTVNNLDNVSNRFAVPNYLTSRRLNFRVSVRF
jgi:hypothetical protein